MRGRWSEHGPAVWLLIPDVSFTLPFNEGRFVPWSPAPRAAPLDCLGILPPPGALWAAAGLVADAVAATELQKGPAGGAPRVSARDRAAAMGKGSGPRADAGPCVLG